MSEAEDSFPPAPPSDAVPSITSETPEYDTGSLDPVTDDQPSSRFHFWMGIISSRINRMIMILTYPFVVIFTITSLLLVIIFCVFPTLIFMTLGVCIYYCMMEDPIPLSVLLRYMLSPDPDDANYHHPSPYSQSRGSIQAKLVIRKLLRIEETEEDEDAENANGDDTKKEEQKPRRDPFPIQFKTHRKCLHFSEPIIYDEKEEDKQGKDPETRIPLYHRTDTPADEENALDNLSAALAAPPDDDELGLVEIAIGSADDGEESTTVACRAAPSSQEEDTIPDPDNIESSHEDKTDESLLSVPKPATRLDSPVIKATEQLEEVMERVEDYFGITNARERGTACDICLLDFEVDEEVAWSPNPECIHSFHKDCVLDWLMRKPSCPSCRNNYLESKNGDENV